MSPKRLVWPLALWSLATFACDSSRDFVPAPELTDDDLVFVLSSSSESGLHVLGPFIGEARYTETRSISLPDDAEVRFVRVSIAGLRALSPILDESRLSELAIEAGAELCPTGRQSLDQQRYALAQAAPTWLVLEDGEWISEKTSTELALLVPIDQAQCWARPPPRFQAFGDDLLLVRTGLVVGSDRVGVDDAHQFLETAFPMGPDHLLVATFPKLLVFERGRGWSNDPRHYLEASALPDPGNGPHFVFRALAVDPLVGPEGHTLHIAYVRAQDGALGSGGGVVSTHWTPANGFGPLETRFESDELRLFELSRDETRQWVAVGDQGQVLSGGFDETEITLDRIVGGGDLRRVLDTGDPIRPHAFVDSTLDIYLAEGSAGGWTREQSGRLFGGLSAATARRTPLGLEVFLAPRDGELTMRKADGMRATFDFNLPPDAFACSSGQDACGPRLLSGLAADVDLSPDGTLLLTLESCGLMLEVNLDKGCARSIPIPFEDQTDQERTRLRIARFEGARLYVTGTNGLIAEAEWALSP